MIIRVRSREQRLHDFIEDQTAWLIVALPFFVLDNAALVIELLLRDRAQQITHAVAFQPEGAFKRRLGNGLEIIRTVEIGRAVVIGRTHFLQVLEVVFRRIFGAVEHEVFEQMGETGLALRFVLGTDIVPHGQRDDGRLFIGMHNDIEAIVQGEFFIGNLDFVDQHCERCGLVQSAGFGNGRRCIGHGLAIRRCRACCQNERGDARSKYRFHFHVEPPSIKSFDSTRYNRQMAG